MAHKVSTKKELWFSGKEVYNWLIGALRTRRLSGGMICNKSWNQESNESWYQQSKIKHGVFLFPFWKHTGLSMSRFLFWVFFLGFFKMSGLFLESEIPEIKQLWRQWRWSGWNHLYELSICDSCDRTYWYVPWKSSYSAVTSPAINRVTWLQSIVSLKKVVLILWRCVLQDSLTLGCTWLVHMPDVAYSYVWHDLFMCLTWESNDNSMKW